ncbi:MAG TPA: energy transducer TonB [Opitutaceae bacterium]|nr:energy transducer TonB [Opitutaceae bacterium]
MSSRNTSLASFFLICVSVLACRAEEPASAPIEKPTKEMTSTLVDGTVVVTTKLYGDFDKGPMPLAMAVAKYPAAQRTKHITGQAIVSFTLDAKGTAKDFQTKATHPDFAKAALEAAQRSRFVAAKKGGKPVLCRLEWIFDFPGPWVDGK